MMEHEPDEPKMGLFAITLGKGHAEKALSVTREDGVYTVLVDGYPQSEPSEQWRQAFGPLIRRTPMLIGRPVKQDEYERIIANQLGNAFAGIDADKPIDLNRAKIPF
jgi:hypothetical protein